MIFVAVARGWGTRDEFIESAIARVTLNLLVIYITYHGRK
jgi:hypothetical protein